MNTNSKVRNLFRAALLTGTMALGGQAPEATAQEGVIPKVREEIRETLGIKNPIFPELKRGIGKGIAGAQAATPDLTKINPDPDSIGKTISDKASIENVRELYENLDPKKPAVISYTAKQCIPCKYVKEASRAFMEDPEFANLRNEFNIIQVQEENDGNLTLKYISKTGELEEETLKKGEGEGFMGKFKPLFAQYAEIQNSTTASTPTMGFLYRGSKGEVKMTTWNVLPRLNQTTPNTAIEFGTFLGREFMKRMPSPKHIINPALLKDTN